MYRTRHALANWAALFLALFVATTVAEIAHAAGKPPVRAITTFVEIDPSRLEPQVRDIAKRLRDARAVFQQAGYGSSASGRHAHGRSTIRTGLSTQDARGDVPFDFRGGVSRSPRSSPVGSWRR